jgi:hypothetical protein
VRLCPWLHKKWLILAHPFVVERARVEPCNCQPLDIPDAEFTARALFYNFHVKKNGKLKWQAFQPERGKTEISVMRAGCLSPTDCKRKAKQMETVRKQYRGFALLHTGDVRKSDFDVIDSRQVFCGHADLLLGVPPLETVDGEPPDPEISLTHQQAGEKLLKLTHQRMDSIPSTDAWQETDSWFPA